MKLQRQSKLVRWAYSFDGKHDVPSYTSLCAFFWRAFVFVPLGWASIVGIVLFVIVMLVGGAWQHPRTAILVTTFMVVFTGLVVNDKAINRKFRGIGDSIEESVFWQGLVATKSKFCPLIEIESEPELAPLGSDDWPDFYDLG
jgi:hypothetical protein